MEKDKIKAWKLKEKIGLILYCTNVCNMIALIILYVLHKRNGSSWMAELLLGVANFREKKEQPFGAIPVSYGLG